LTTKTAETTEPTERTHTEPTERTHTENTEKIRTIPVANMK